MGQRLDQMRAAAAAGKKPKPQPKPAAKPTLLFRCGHTEVLANFTQADCPACKNLRRQQRAVEKRAKREAANPQPVRDRKLAVQFESAPASRRKPIIGLALAGLNFGLALVNFIAFGAGESASHGVIGAGCLVTGCLCLIVRGR